MACPFQREGIFMRASLTAAIAPATWAAASPACPQGTWTALKPIPQGEEEVYGTAAGGKLYVLGGLGVFPGWEPKQMLWSFDPATSEWTRLPNIPEGLHHPGFAAIGDKLYSIGGVTIAPPPAPAAPPVARKRVGVYDNKKRDRAQR